jgi:hypothetical protein
MPSDGSADGRVPARGHRVKIEVHPDDDLVARKAAAIIAVDARAAVPSRGRFIMAISGGNTPWLMLRALADEQLPWENVHVAQVDERAAPVTSRTGSPGTSLLRGRDERDQAPAASLPRPATLPHIAEPRD